MAGNNIVMELIARLMTRVPWGGFSKEEIQRVIDDIDNVVPEFVRFIKSGGRVTVVVAQKVFPTWRKAKVGVLKTTEAYAEAIKAAGREINAYAAQVLAKVVCAEVEGEIELVEVLDSDLPGIVGNYTYERLIRAAEACDLIQVPAEAALVVAAEFTDQPVGDYKLFAMKGIAHSDGNLDVFYVDRDFDGPWLRANVGRPAHVWRLGYRWVFARRKHQPSA